MAASRPVSAVLHWCLAIAVAASASAVFWVALHPRIRAFGQDGQVQVDDGVRYSMFTDSGLFIIITTVGAFVLSALFLLDRHRIALTLGEVFAGAMVMTIYATVVWLLGVQIDGLVNDGVWPFPPEKLADRREVFAALRLQTYGALALPALVWSLASLVDALLGRRVRRR
ncbi:MAG: hypothetical protein RL745_790 [Actinomycetota bacterium]